MRGACPDFIISSAPFLFLLCLSLFHPCSHTDAGFVKDIEGDGDNSKAERIGSGCDDGGYNKNHHQCMTPVLAEKPGSNKPDFG